MHLLIFLLDQTSFPLWGIVLLYFLFSACGVFTTNIRCITRVDC